ncbi:hypothetical protein BTO11_15015 [Psychrosphaera saromensis]|uniref:DUF1579 domain-containing protein n=2 Tax=Psychrosphaera saromensis TaxID=716813 RepID=A0A2S7UZY3_9GAMM|nr:hypothetical protein [Psychrosphaera saromensis]PQJ54831.1 hypothetical protein BTO11_15015 [Psychrosphaera saromensis]
MNMKKIYCLLLSITLFCSSPYIHSETSQEEQVHLNLMSNVIGGKWWLGTDSYKVFEWGLGRTQIKMKHFMIEAGNEYIVSEGFFYYSPDSFSIKGISTFQKKGKAPELLEYFGNVENGSLEFIYKSITLDGEIEIYTETWKWVNENQYQWMLVSLEDDIPAKKGVYIRKPN